MLNYEINIVIGLIVFAATLSCVMRARFLSKSFLQPISFLFLFSLQRLSYYSNCSDGSPSNLTRARRSTSQNQHCFLSCSAISTYFRLCHLAGTQIILASALFPSNISGRLKNRTGAIEIPSILQGLGFLLLIGIALPAAADICSQRGLALQILGSGGPIADDDRAASGYLIWHEGRARVLVDAGGGVFVRFGQSGARIEDLDLLALTHLHTDHAADLPAIFKGGYFSPRTAMLSVSGPTGNHLMPSVGDFLKAMFSEQHGAFRYLSGFLKGTDGLFTLRPIEVDADSRQPQSVFENKHLKVTAVGVNHGSIPTLGYLFEIAGKRIAIGGDQNLEDPAFTKLATAADIMVMPMAIPENAGPVARSLHATPSKIGLAANKAQPAHLIISHLMRRSLRNLNANLAEIRRHYKGNLTVAEDLDCFDLS